MEDQELKFIEPRGGLVTGPGPVKKAMEQVLSVLQSRDAMDGIVVVMALSEQDLQEGVNKMKEYPEAGVVLCVPSFAGQLRDSAIMRRLSESPRLKLVRSIDLGEILAKIELLQKKKVVEASVSQSGILEIEYDPAVLELTMGVNERILAVLRHDLKPYVIAQKGENYRKIIDKAREVFEIKDSATDEQVVDFIVNSKAYLLEKMTGEIAGVYCDLDDTLLMRDGSVNLEMVGLLEQYRAEGKTVRIWTGGELAEARGRIAGTVLEAYQLVSKYDYTGAIAEIVVDNVSIEKFMVQYGIKPKNYVRV